MITNPAEYVTRAISAVRELSERSQPPCPYVVDSKWEEELHDYLGHKSPCCSGNELDALWPDVFDTLAARAVTAGPMSYLGWNDGDPEFVRAIWCDAVISGRSGSSKPELRTASHPDSY